MTLYEELIERGLIAQVTNEEEISKMINEGKATFYIGFDPTADSLHVGHFMALCLMKRLQMAGNKPIALLGGGTGMIGDPSGKTDMRKMLTKEDIEHNIACFKKQMSRFIDFSDGKALLVNNADWLLSLNYVDVLREVGACFSVNKMLSAECYKQRMERGLSFLEFNYMIMQSYDFYKLYKDYGCNMQFGGDDQYWRNVADADVMKCIKMLTFLPLEQIREMESWEGAQLNKAKEILAYELTKLVHGEEEAEKALAAAKELFGGKGVSGDMPTAVMPAELVNDGKIGILDALVASKLCPSKREARTNVTGGGISVNDEKVTDPAAMIEIGEFAVIKKGKKSYCKIVKA